jgi:hypothetical protein
MDAIRGFNSSPGQEQENAIPGDKKHNNINGSPENEKIILKKEIDEVEENDDKRINISISRKAYDALEKFTKELNQRDSKNQKPFTLEEVLDEEVIFLFSDEYKEQQSQLL